MAVELERLSVVIDGFGREHERHSWLFLENGFSVTCYSSEKSPRIFMRCVLNTDTEKTQAAPKKLKLREEQQCDEIWPMELMLASQSGQD